MTDSIPAKAKMTWLKLGKLELPERELKTYTDDEIGEHIGHIQHFGQTRPVYVHDGKIIDGEQWYLAAERCQMVELPVVDLSSYSEADARAYAIAIKALAERGEWDWATVVSEWEWLEDAGFPDLDLTGFDLAEREEIRNELIDAQSEDDAKDNAMPPVEVYAVSHPDDVWLLGNHRLMCGDSTNQEHVDKLMDGQSADFCFTSPPYLQQRDYVQGVADWDLLMQGAFVSAQMKPGAQILVNLGLVHREGEWIPYWQDWVVYMQSIGWKRFGLYVWDQGHGMMGNWAGRLAPSFELIFHFCRKPLVARKTKKKHAENIKVSESTQRTPDGGLKPPSSPEAGLNTHKIPDSVIRVTRHKGALKVEGDSASHPAIFPVALPVEIMSPWTKAGDICYEPFCGSGTQIIAAEKTERRCFAMELVGIYADLAVRRWQQYTGEIATLDADGRPFHVVQEERQNRHDETD